MQRHALQRLSRLTLGTAQLGGPYGIANRIGRPTDSEVCRILDSAWAEGITCFDTAAAYGDAEARIGQWCAASGRHPMIISKLPAAKDVDDLHRFVHSQIEASRRRLRRETIDGYLAHRFADIRQPAILEDLQRAVADGRIRTFGASVYHPDEASEALEIPGIGLLQAPINLFDRRFIDSRILARCSQQGVTLFARSVFLQGALLLHSDRLPPHLRVLAPHLRRLQDLAHQAGDSVLHLAVAAVSALPAVASLVIGVEAAEQLYEIAAASRRPAPAAEILDAGWRVGEGLPDGIINPAQWPKTAL